MKKFANESKLNIKIAQQSSSFAKELIIAVLSFFISLSFLNLAFSSLALQKEGFSMIAVVLSLVLIAVFEGKMLLTARIGIAVFEIAR